MMSRLSDAVERIAATLSVIARCCENMSHAATAQEQPPELRWRSINYSTPPEGQWVLLWEQSCGYPDLPVVVGKREGSVYLRAMMKEPWVVKAEYWMHIPICSQRSYS